MKISLITGVCIWLSTSVFAQVKGHFTPVNFAQVSITDSFWKPKIDKVATVTLAACIYQTEEKTGRIRNFEKVVKGGGEKHEGIYYDDSDVYKAIEAIAYALKTHPDPKLEAKADSWIQKICAAQLPDGYINTYYTLRGLDQRWTDIEKHEDYCAGHLIEAAVAYYDATGKRPLLDAAIRFANHIDSVFRIPNRKWISGHQEIELALVKLYRITKDERHLKLADWYLQQRGYRYPYPNSWITPDYWQDVAPVKDQAEISGHAVRAMYLYTGAADVAALTGDAGYVTAMKKVWEDVVHRNMYITGGIGSAGDNEGFTKDYDLPNGKAYCETCASVGMVFWNQRMSQLLGESKYVDVLERSLYNGALDGLSLSGDRFFYDNPLASQGQHSRKAWFGTACCPSNIARLVSSVGNYIYGQSADGIWVNLFAGSETTINIGKTPVQLKTTTNYPWDGNVTIDVDPDRKKKFSVYLRVPGWLKGEIVPGNLYTTQIPVAGAPVVKINGVKQSYSEKDGYLILTREWKKGDRIEYEMPMDVRVINSNPEVKANEGSFAIQRGPLVYCIEAADNPDGVWNVLGVPGMRFTTKPYEVHGEKVVAIETEMNALVPGNDPATVSAKKRKVTAVPYYTWANRGANDMQVWLPTKIRAIQVNTKD